MKISFPHMGYLNIPILNLFRNLGIEAVEAPPISGRTVALGTRNSPEGVCLPYKINMGNFLESIEQGADTLVTICGAGKCRMGFYNAVQKIGLANNKQIQLYTINTDHLFNELYRFLCMAAKHSSRISVLQNIALTVKTLKVLDDINNAKNDYAARSNNPGEMIRLFNESVAKIAQCQNFNEIRQIKDSFISQMQASFSPADTHPPQIIMLGEFYTLMEPYVNYGLENFLAKQGIAVRKPIHTGEWAYSKMFMQTLGLYNEEKKDLAKARPYLNYHVGGEGLASVGNALWGAQNSYDGIIHLYPFGCMPEIVAQYALQNIAADYNIPLLSLSLDEHASEVGVITRVEAFIDCIKRKRAPIGTPSYFSSV
jgi:predicted nucleotide-binding protein (sugar kinase/HSP70/actin superfamily)